MNLDEVIPGACGIVSALRCEKSRAEFAPRSRLPYLSRDGRELFLGVAGSILRDENSRPVGNVVIFQDVTKVVKMERELRRSERLAAVGEMAAKMAHEIRNPLAAISGSIQVLQRDRAAESQEGEPACLMDIVVRETDRLNDLIADFLHYARPRPLRIEAVSLSSIVEELLKMLEALRPENVVIQSAALQDLVVAADADQLRQVLWNLSLNALQAMPEGGELLLSSEVVPPPIAQGSSQLSRKESGSAEEDLGNSAWVEICVRDTGVGIDAESQERIFEPFYTTKPKGTGLGLAMVHRIVEAHGGVLRVKSEPGQGTAVGVAFPRFAADASES
jgi:two-component system sensor histidine kinase PilS (NtrC family)